MLIDVPPNFFLRSSLALFALSSVKNLFSVGFTAGLGAGAAGLGAAFASLVSGVSGSPAACHFSFVARSLIPAKASASVLKARRTKLPASLRRFIFAPLFFSV
jgi:hypothetical protein